jgi:hypothetical protein
MLVFDHNLCPKASNAGAVGNCFQPPEVPASVLPYHEMGHQTQVSILGDLGTSTVAAGDWLYRLFTLQWENLGTPVKLTLEPWAEDFGLLMINGTRP